MKRKFVIGIPPPANEPQRQPTPQQVDNARRIIGHDHRRSYGEGAKGATVRAMQIYLASQGYEPGRFDGDWGAKTQAAFAAYNNDRGQSAARATPEVLASMSKEAGQPLPRQRPAQMADATIAAPEISAPPGIAAPISGQPQPDPNEFGPERLHWDNLARDATAAPPTPPLQPPPPPQPAPQPAPQPDNRWNNAVASLGGTGLASAAPAFDRARFNAASDPVVADDSIQQSDLPGFASPHTSGGVPSGLMNAVANRRNQLRDALIGRDLLTGAPSGPPSRQAMLEALTMARAGR